MWCIQSESISFLEVEAAAKWSWEAEWELNIHDFSVFARVSKGFICFMKIKYVLRYCYAQLQGIVRIFWTDDDVIWQNNQGVYVISFSLIGLQKSMPTYIGRKLSSLLFHFFWIGCLFLPNSRAAPPRNLVKVNNQSRKSKITTTIGISGNMRDFF